MHSYFCLGLFVLASLHLSNAESSFYLSNNQVNWHEANIECNQRGQRLAVVDSAVKTSQINQLIAQTSKYTQTIEEGGWMLYCESVYSTNNFVYLLPFADRKAQSFWIGATNLNSNVNNNLNYFWLPNGRPLSYTNWDAGQPDNYGTIEHCVQIWGSQKWNDVPCGNQYYFICEEKCRGDNC